MTINIKIITGLSGDAQGFGDMTVSNLVRELLISLGFNVDILYIECLQDLIDDLHRNPCDLAWPSLYFVSEYTDHIIPINDHLWIQDILDAHQIPYIGSNGASMRCMLDKAMTTQKLVHHGIDVPWQHIAKLGGNLPTVNLPAFVKPRYGSESSGIGEHSVATNVHQVENCVAVIHRDLRQDALVEEYLPGREFTVLMIGNGESQYFYPVENIVNPDGVERFAILTKQLKMGGWLDFTIPYDRKEELHTLGEKVVYALGCCDHVRIDIREDVNGLLKVIDVNGIPGMNPAKSRSLVAHNLYSMSSGLPSLVAKIVNSALTRHELRDFHENKIPLDPS